jgi:hypothetical protein
MLSLKILSMQELRRQSSTMRGFTTMLFTPDMLLVAFKD